MTVTTLREIKIAICDKSKNFTVQTMEQIKEWSFDTNRRVKIEQFNDINEFSVWIKSNKDTDFILVSDNNDVNILDVTSYIKAVSKNTDVIFQCFCSVLVFQVVVAFLLIVNLK